MGERPDQIERHIQRQRDELGDNFSELEDKVKSAFDWRSQFEEHPGMLLGAAFVGGAVLAAILPAAPPFLQASVPAGNTSTTGGILTPLNTQILRRNTLLRHRYLTRPRVALPIQISQRVKVPKFGITSENAAIGLATTRLSEYIEDLVPGFSEHYKKAASGKPTTFGNVPTPQEQHQQQQHNWQKPNGGTDYASHS